jgi:hypothetical protein
MSAWLMSIAFAGQVLPLLSAWVLGNFVIAGLMILTDDDAESILESQALNLSIQL